MATPHARPRLLSSLRWKLSTAISGVVLLCIASCVAGAVVFLRQTLTDHERENLRHTLSGVSAYMSTQKSEILGAARFIAADPVVEADVQTGDRQALLVHLIPLYAALNFDIIDVVDTHGRMLLRMENQDASGDYVGSRYSVRRALIDDESFGLQADLPRQESAGGYALRGTVPLLEGSRIVGAIVVGRQLDSVFASRIGSALNTQVNLIAGGQKTGTTVTDAYGFGDTGATEPSDVLARINSGKPSIGQVGNGWFRNVSGLSGLVPLAAPDHKPVGAIEIVSPLGPLYDLIKQLSFLLIALGAVVVSIGTLLALGIAKRLTRRLLALEATASHVAAAAHGNAPLQDLQSSVAVSGDDEVASLARSLGAMMTALDERVAVNARLYDAAQARVRELTGLAEIARLLTAAPSVHETLGMLGEHVCRLVGCEAVAIWLPGGGPSPALYGGHGLPETYVDSITRTMSEMTASGDEITSQRALRTGEVSWRRFDSMIPAEVSAHADLRSRADALHWKSATSVPLRIQGRPVGALTCYTNKASPMEQSDLSLLATIADQVAVAVENARLYAQSRQVAALEERARLARELHDSVTQALFSMTLHTRAAQMSAALEGHGPDGALGRSLEQLHDLTQSALAEMRALIFELRPGALSEEGLAAALLKHTAAVSAREGLEIKVVAPDDRLGLDSEVEEQLYRMSQEALHNVVKHASATHVAIHLSFDEAGAIVLEIIDDGDGFNEGAIAPGHMGLHTMSDRVRQVGGALRITSRPGQGTIVRASVPSLALAARRPEARAAGTGTEISA
jgi:signal transduction histidine kinase